MKVLVLNTWEGKLEKEITDYLILASKEFDVFLFQEVNENMKFICDEILKDCFKIIDIKVSDNKYSHYNQAIYFKNNFTLIDETVICCEDKSIGCLQCVCLRDDNGLTYNIVNVHGVTNKGDNKLDYDDRIKQSEVIVDYLRGREGVKIIAGDFNILRNAKSIMLFSQNGYQDLIRDFDIVTTRNNYAWDRFETKMLDSDYVFVDIGTKVKSFEVDDCLVSDHLPMMVEV